MKKALMPIAIIAGVVVVLIAAAYLYEQKWGAEGSFPSEHFHGDGHDHSGENLPHKH